MVGATMPPTARATRSHTPVGRITSTFNGKCGPCCSVAPTAMNTIALAAIFCCHSGQDNSAMKTLSTITISSMHCRAAIDAETLAGDEAGAGPCQKQDHSGNLFRFPDAAERVRNFSFAQTLAHAGKIQQW